MNSDQPNITAAELRILKVLWEVESGTVRDVLDHIAADTDERPAYTTVMTVMNQLASKGALDVDRGRQPFVYRPIAGREQVLGQRLKQFLNTVFDGQAGELVLRVVEQAALSPQEFRRIEAKIDAQDACESKRSSAAESSDSEKEAS